MTVQAHALALIAVYQSPPFGGGGGDKFAMVLKAELSPMPPRTILGSSAEA